MGAGRLRIFFNVNVRNDYIARRVHIVSEKAGDVVFILLNDLKSAGGSVESLTARGELRNADQHAALVKIGPLFAKADLY